MAQRTLLTPWPCIVLVTSCLFTFWTSTASCEINMSTARLREALNAGAPGNSKEKGPPVADGILSVTPDTPEAAEWRTRQSAIDFPSSSSSYLEDEEDSGCNKPSDLYGKFTWKIDNFSEINKRELRSNVFEVGSYKWYILVYPQGCDVCNHLSLFLCVADYDKLLPGWSHFAQFTIAVVNKDPKKSKYSDTLHRFCKKEHDWGWKKFMELSKVLDGFTVADTLVIKAQVQVIKDRISRPFRCLDPQYRRELVRVYLTNVEGICRRFVEERRDRLGMLRETPEAFKAFWHELSDCEKGKLAKEKCDLVLKGIVKRFFNEKEVTSTLVMDAIYSGCCAMEEQTRLWIFRESVKDPDPQQHPVEPPHVYLDSSKGVFSLGDNVLQALERAANESIPAFRDDKCNDGSCIRSHGDDDYGKDSVDRDERRLAELGRRTVEMFVLTHVYTEILEVSYREAESLKRQEALIREEEELERIEGERHQARQAAEKERRNRKKERKEKAKKARRDQEDEEKRRLADLARLAAEDKERKDASHQALVHLQADCDNLPNEHSLACDATVADECGAGNDVTVKSVEYPSSVIRPLDPSLSRSELCGKEHWNTDISCMEQHEMAPEDNHIISKIVTVLEKKVEDMEIQLVKKDQDIYMLQSQLAEATGSGNISTGNVVGEFSHMDYEGQIGSIEDTGGITTDVQDITTRHGIHAHSHSSILDVSEGIATLSTSGRTHVTGGVHTLHPQVVACATIIPQYSSNTHSASGCSNLKVAGNGGIPLVNLGVSSYRNVTLGQTDDLSIGARGALQQGLASGGLRLPPVDANCMTSKVDRQLHYQGLYERIPCHSLPGYHSPNKAGFPVNANGGDSPGLEEFAHIGLINDLLGDH